MAKLRVLFVFFLCALYAVIAGYASFMMVEGVFYFSRSAGRLHVVVLFLVVALLDAVSIVWVTRAGVRVLGKRTELWRLVAIAILTAIVGFAVNYIMVFVGLLAVAGWVP